MEAEQVLFNEKIENETITLNQNIEFKNCYFYKV